MDRYEDNPSPVVDCSNDPVLTQQSDAVDCDINVIVARAKAGADLSRLVRAEGTYGDFTQLPDLRSAMLAVNHANYMFMQLDPFVRKRFNNNPAELLDFLNDENNREEAMKMGLLKKPEEPKKDETLETLKSIDSSLKAGSGQNVEKPKGGSK